MEVRLTQRSVDAAKAPETGQIFLRDSEVLGFALRITASGSKSFIWEGRVRGRTRRITIGAYPDLSVLLARREATKIRAAIAEGRDPSLERQAQLRERTLKDLCDAYIDRHAKQHKRSWKRDEQMINRYLSKWRSRKLSDITHDEVSRLHQTIGREHGRYAANRTIALLRTILNLARDWGLLNGANPAERIKMFREEKRERFLSPDELKRVNEALTQEPNPYWQAYFPLSLLLGTRRGELLAAKWADLDLEQRTWRIPETKAGRSHLLPLPEAVVAMLQSLPSQGQSNWLFPGGGVTGHLVEPKKAWQRIRQKAGVPDVRIHDLRRTLGSWLAAQGYSLPLIGRALNHTNISTTQVYARLDLEPVRDALERNAKLMLGKAGNESDQDAGAVRRGLPEAQPGWSK
jgi:integrase